MKKFNRRVLAFAMSFAFLLSGCGESKVEEISDYGTTAKTGQAKEKDTGKSEEETGLATEGVTGEKTSVLPEEQLGGDPLWQSNFTVNGKPVEVNITNLYKGQNTLRAQKLKGFSDINEVKASEEAVVKNFFGTTAKEVKREISKANGDSQDICFGIRSILISYPEYADAIKVNGDDITVPGWVDDDSFYYHIYEGTYLNAECEFLYGYDIYGGIKYLALFSKNPGDIVGAPECDDSYIIDVRQDGIPYYLNGKNVTTDLPNRTESSIDALKEKTSEFLMETLSVNVNPEDITSLRNYADTGYAVQNEIVYFPSSEERSKDLNGFVRDGYQLDYSLTGQIYSFAVNGNNRGYFMVTDNGVTGFYLELCFEPGEELAEQVQILKFEDMMSVFESTIKNEFDASKINGQKLSFSTAELILFPMQSEDNSHEYTLIPAWCFVGESNGEVGEVFINAIDGSCINIVYW